MKKIVFLAAVLLIAGAAFAQNTDTTMKDTSGMQMMHDSMMSAGRYEDGMHRAMGKMKDCIMMMNGKVMVMKGGKHMPLNQQMTLSNGTVVMPEWRSKNAGWYYTHAKER